MLSMYCRSFTSACWGEHPWQEYHSIAPWSIMIAKVNPGWLSAAVITNWVAWSIELFGPYQSMITPSMPRLTMSSI